jgi:SAM-dependent methyltransferase
MIGKVLRRRLPWPPVGKADLGALRQPSPVGTCPPGAPGAIDRHLVEELLTRHAADITGRVLAAEDGGYAARLAGAAAVTRVEIGSDATRCDLPEDPAGFDCILLPDALHRVLAPEAVLRALHARLRPGGVLLATLAGAARRTDGTTCWRFTPYSARLLFAAVFGESAVTVSSRGNVLMAVAHAHRLPCAELGPQALGTDDPAFPLMIGVRAVRGADA